MTIIAGRSSSRAPLVHAERRPFLVQRGESVRALRAHLAELDFVEVEPSAMQVSPGKETHVHAWRTELISPGDKRDRRYLRTSPEFACKKLLPPASAASSSS